MADIPTSTDNVTIFDPTGTRYAEVTTDNELKTWSKQVSYPWQYWVEQQKGFVLPATFTITTKNTEYDVFLLRNPLASGIDLHWWKFYLGSTTTATTIILRAYRTPTITTNGTAQTPRNLRLSGPASVVPVYAAPTIAARGTLMQNVLLNSNNGTFIKIEELGYQIEPNEDMLITMEASSNGTLTYITALWAEIPTGT